jgi:hypothetical protein
LGGNRIEIYVDERTAMVTRFYYYWVEIPEISLQDVVEPGVAASEVRALFVDNPEVQISNVTLALCRMPSPEFPASGFVITEQLCWVVSTAQPLADVYCDAFTGEYTGYSIFYWGGEPVTLLSQSNALRTTILVIIAIVVAISGYFLSRRRLNQ